MLKNKITFLNQYKIHFMLSVLIILQSGCYSMHPEVPEIDSYLPEKSPQVSTYNDREIEDKSEVGPRSAENEPHTKKLTLDAALRIAFDKNPLTRVAKEGIVISQESTGETRALYYPDIALGASYSRWETHAFLPDGLINNVSELVGSDIPSIIGPTNDWFGTLEARYTLFDSGERAAKLRAAIAEEGVAKEDAARIQEEIAFTVHQAFYNHSASLETLSVADKNLARAEDHLRIAKGRKAAGDVPRADVLRTEVEVADAKLTLAKAQDLVRVTKGKLNSSMGLPPEAPIEIDTSSLEITSPDRIELQDLLEKAVYDRPEIKMALHSIAASKNNVDAAKSAFGPRLNAEGSFGWRDSDFLPTDEDWSVGVSLEWTLFAGFFRVHKLSKARAVLRKEEAGVARLALDVKEEVWSAYSGLQEAYEAIQASEVQVIDAEESLRVASERYKVGAGTINDLLDAETALLKAEVNLVNAKWDYHTSNAELAKSVGKLVANENKGNV